jgi:hypothetical protein
MPVLINTMSIQSIYCNESLLMEQPLRNSKNRREPMPDKEPIVHRILIVTPTMDDEQVQEHLSERFFKDGEYDGDSWVSR